MNDEILCWNAETPDIAEDIIVLETALGSGPSRGPWYATPSDYHGTGVKGPMGVSLAWCGCNTTAGKNGDYSIRNTEAAANAHFIAACSPDRIRRLLNAVKKRDGAAQPEVERLPQIAKVVQWAKARNLIDGSNPPAQMLKFTEEAGELAAAIARNERADAKDAIGDCTVVLIILAEQLGLSFEECLESAWLEIKDRKGRMVNGVFVKEADGGR